MTERVVAETSWSRTVEVWSGDVLLHTRFEVFPDDPDA